MQHVQDGREEGAAMRRTMLVLLAVSLSFSFAAFASFPVLETPPLPVGWELNIIPGFDPCIELALEDTYSAHSRGRSTEEMKRDMEKWGEAAVGALIRLYEDPRWNEYRCAIAGHLGAMPTEESRAWANRYICVLLDKPKWSKEECNAFGILVIAFGHHFDDATFELALKRLPAFAASVSVESHDPTPFDEICRLFEYTRREGLAEVLEAHVMQGDHDTRETCIKRLVYHRPASAILAALRLGDETYNDRRRHRLISLLKYEGGSIRAREQMSNVLEAEVR